MNDIEIAPKTRFTVQYVADVIASAHIAYWGSWRGPRPEAVVAGAETAEIAECPDGPDEVEVTYKLDRAAIERGLKLMAEEWPHHWRDLTTESADAFTGDVLIQLSVLGEIRYG
jgi:hypothetical protein